MSSRALSISLLALATTVGCGSVDQELDPSNHTAEVVSQNLAQQPELEVVDFTASSSPVSLPREPEAGAQSNVSGLIDDSEPDWSYRGYWKAGAGVPGSIYGTLHSSNVSGSEALHYCTAVTDDFGITYLVIYYSRAYNRGIAEVWMTRPGLSTPLDGVFSYDMYGSGIQRAQALYVAFSGLSQGEPYDLHVRVSGRKNPASSDIFVDIDALDCS